jgi:hypothetical protein
MARFFSLMAALTLFAGASATPANTRGADELLWAGSFEQALDMADHTGKPIFLMFYTLVGKGCATYTGDEKTVY